MIIGTMPLTNNAEENFNIVILEVNYAIRQVWNILGFWNVDITGPDGEVLVYGVKITSGITLLKQYPQIPWDLQIDAEVDPGRFDLAETIVSILSK